MYYIDKQLSEKILFLGVSKHTKGGMTAVLVSYDKYIDSMRAGSHMEAGKQAGKIMVCIPSVSENSSSVGI